MPRLRFKVLLLLLAVELCSCKKFGNCGTSTGLDQFCPFDSPSWSPDGAVLIFNHTPVFNFQNKEDGCGNTIYTYSMSDSSGLWLVRKDGSNLHRAYSRQLPNPRWSPDGKWLTFSFYGIIYKMGFDGAEFDTSHIVQLTSDKFLSFFPSFSPAGDSIFFDSNEFSGSALYQVCKMAADGSAHRVIGNRGIDSVASRQPNCAKDGTVIHVRGDSRSTYVFSMDQNGGDVQQISLFNGNDVYVRYPCKQGQNFYYEDYGVWMRRSPDQVFQKIIDGTSNGFSVRNDGVIAFIDFDVRKSSPVDKTHACIKIANPDGSNPKVLVGN